MTSTGLCAFIRRTDLNRSPSSQPSLWRLHLASPCFRTGFRCRRAWRWREPSTYGVGRLWPRADTSPHSNSQTCSSRYRRLLAVIASRSLKTLRNQNLALRQRSSQRVTFAIPGCWPVWLSSHTVIRSSPKKSRHHRTLAFSASVAVSA